MYLLNKERFETIDEMGAEERQGGLEQEMLQTPEVDPVLVKIGYGLIPFVDEEQGGDLLDRVPKLRTRLVNDLGFPVPLIRVRDDLLLGATKYIIELWGVMVAEGELVPGHMMALSPSGMPRRTNEGIR